MAPAEPWFVGSWTGRYEVRQHRVERPSVQIAWARDDGSRYVGEGFVTFTVDARGRLRGAATGVLGEQRVVGAIDADAFTFELVGDPSPEATNGVVRCGSARSGSDVTCSLQATSGDGNFVRAGSLRLRQGPAPKP